MVLISADVGSIARQFSFVLCFFFNNRFSLIRPLYPRRIYKAKMIEHLDSHLNKEENAQPKKEKENQTTSVGTSLLPAIFS